MKDAIDLIQRDHRALAAVLHCFEQVLAEVKSGALLPDFALFQAIVDYVEDFPDRYHHPKEDEALFPLVRRRAPETAAALDELQRQHKDGLRKTADLRWRLDEWRKAPKDGFAAFHEAARAFIEFQRKHLAKEERDIIPVARAKFTAADWATLEAALADHADPMFGDRPKAAFDALFTRIANLAPAPHGLAERRAPAPPKRASVLDQIGMPHWV